MKKIEDETVKFSKPLATTMSLVFDAVFKTTKIDLRIHDEENIPDQPVLYLINHFTRIETTIMPYILHKIVGKYPVSLADAPLFSGKFGVFLQKMGAISTKNPLRDRMIVSKLLRNETPAIIFPEGQMIKDKKIIEKGKYVVYNTGMRRPPHTGSARIALRAEFFREKIRNFYDNDNFEELNKYKDYFNITDEDIKKIVDYKTIIMPVNLTYHPIRAKYNAFNKLIDKYVSNPSKRLHEEIEVEGTMIIDGVDIDINFGKPITVADYLYLNNEVRQKTRNKKLYINKKEFNSEINLRKNGLELMKRYMDDIYGLTTVNHDHIFAHFVNWYPYSKISISDIKNRTYLAIEKLMDMPLTNIHTTLRLKQRSLVANEVHERLNNFIEAAISDDLIRVENDMIIRNKKRFSNNYEFHDVRQDNIVEVLTNEIEPLVEVRKMLNSLMFLPPFVIRKRIRDKFYKRDLTFFKDDYKQFFIDGESKPTNIGKPFFMKKPFSKNGILLIHGYMAAPEEVRALAKKIYDAGYSVYGVRLRGHGTAPEDLASRDWEAWYNSVNRGYAVLNNSVKNIAIAGFSTGAGLALFQSTISEKNFKGVISINAPLKLVDIKSKFSSTVVKWNKLLDKFHTKKGQMEFVENQPDNPHINYLRNPIAGISQLVKFMNKVDDELDKIKIPALIVQGSRDPVVNPKSAEEIYKKISSKDKTLKIVEATNHGIINGEHLDEVAKLVIDFLKKIF